LEGILPVSSGDKTGEMGAVQIPLRHDTTGTRVMPLRQGFFLDSPALARLGKSCRPGGEFVDLPASAFSLAFQVTDEFSAGATLGRAAKPPLPRFVREFFHVEDIAHLHQQGDLSSVFRFSMLRELPLHVLQFRARFFHPFGGLPPLGAFLARPVGVIVLSVFGPPLAVEFALESSNLLLPVMDTRGEFVQESAVLPDSGEGRRAEIESDNALAEAGRTLFVRPSVEDELDEKAGLPA